MTIQGIGNNIYSPYRLPPTRTTSQAGGSSSPSPQAANDVSTYDFTNMTGPQMLQTVNSLIKSGRMSLEESSSLVGIMGFAGASPLLSRGRQANQPVDFVAALKNQISYNEEINNAAAVKYENMALSALQRLQGTLSKVNVSA